MTAFVVSRLVSRKDRRPAHLQQHIPRGWAPCPRRRSRCPRRGPRGAAPVGELATLRTSPDLSAQVARGPGPHTAHSCTLLSQCFFFFNVFDITNPAAPWGETPGAGGGGAALAPSQPGALGGLAQPGEGGSLPLRASPCRPQPAGGRAAPNPKTPLGHLPAAISGSDRSARATRVRLKKGKGDCPQAAPEVSGGVTADGWLLCSARERRERQKQGAGR